MLSTRKSRGALVTGVACAAIVLASLAGLGCQSDEGTRTDKIIVRNPQKSRPVSTLALPSPPAIDTTSIPTRPVDDAVSVPSVPQEVTYEEAEAAFNERRYERAVELFTQYTGRKTENPWGHYMLGLSAWKAGDYARAEQALQQAIELDPLHVKSWLNLGRVFLDTDRPSEALDRIDQALSIDNQSGVAYRLQGRAFRQLGQKNDAVRAYRHAIQLDDQDAWSMNNLGLMFIEERRFDDALPPLARAIELRSDVAVFFNNLGMALEGNGHFRSAEEAYKSAIIADESYYKAVVNLTRVEAVAQDPSIGPMDLTVLAQRFADEMAGWDDDAVASDHESVDGKPEPVRPTPESGEPEADATPGSGADSIVVSEADSTAHGREQ